MPHVPLSWRRYHFNTLRAHQQSAPGSSPKLYTAEVRALFRRDSLPQTRHEILSGDLGLILMFLTVNADTQDRILGR